MKSLRLDKYLADMGIGTRSEIKEKIKKGLVTVNGENRRAAGSQGDAGRRSGDDGKRCGGLLCHIFLLYVKQTGGLRVRYRGLKT